MRTAREKCGCKYERGSGRERYVELCDQHAVETQEIRARWAADLAARRASNELPEEKQS